MVDVVSIIVSIAAVILLIGVSFYLYIMYCHPQDKGIGVSIPAKIIIILSQAIAWGQLLIIPLDVSVSTEVSSTTMEIIYNVFYWVMLFMSILIIPFFMNIYESSQSDSWASRICWSVLFSFVMALVFSAIIFISYIWLGVFYVQVTVNNGSPVYIQQRVFPGLYVMLCLAFIGWILLAINGGIGFVYLPHDLIEDFVKRPKQQSSQDAFQKKSLLQKKSQKLVQQGQLLKTKTAEYEKKKGQKSWFQRRKQQSDLKSSLEIFKKEVDQLQAQHQIFSQQLTITKHHPLVYWLSLFFGILTGIVSLIWYIQLLGTTIYSSGTPMLPFIDSFLVDLTSGPVSFIATGIYAGMVMYLMICAIKGNIVFGIRIPYLISFHAMKKNKTLLNSFLFNVNLMMLYSLAITQLSIIAFPNYMQNTYLYKFFIDAVYNLPMFGFIYKNRIFPGALIIVVFMAIIASIIKAVLQCRRKGRKQQQQGQQNKETQLKQMDSRRTS